MKATIRKLGFLATTALVLIPAGTGAGRTAPQSVTPVAESPVTEEAAAVNTQVRDYFAANGRKIRISILGTYIATESPKGHFPLESHCDVFAYQVPKSPKPRVVWVCGGQISTTDGKSDLQLLSFKGPRNGTQFRVGQDASTTSRLRSSDKLIDITVENTCKMGTGECTHITTTRNASHLPGANDVPISYITTKHVYHTTPSESRIVNVEMYRDRLEQWDPCCCCSGCPPCPDAIPGAGGFVASVQEAIPGAAGFVASVQGANALARVNLAGDTAGLRTSVCGPTLPAPVQHLDVTSTLCWRFPHVLKPGQSDKTRTSTLKFR